MVIKKILGKGTFVIKQNQRNRVCEKSRKNCFHVKSEPQENNWFVCFVFEIRGLFE